MNQGWRWTAALVVVLGLGWMLVPGVAWATSPDPPEEVWDDPRFAAGPPAAAAPLRWAPPAQTSDPTNPNSPGFWADIQAQGSKWVMDTVIVGTSASLLSAVSGVAGLASSSSGLIFRTPRELTIDLTGLPLGSPRAVAEVISQFGLAMIVVLGVYRLAGVITDYDSRALLEVGVQAVVATAVTLGSWELCGIMIDVANLLADQVVRNAFGGALPSFQAPEIPTAGGVSLVYSFAAFLHYMALLLLLFEAFRRIAVVNLLICVSPLIGVAVMSNGGWNYARVWLLRMAEVLFTPILWAVALAVAQATITAWLMAGPGDATQRAVMALLLSAFAYLTVVSAPRSVGIAAGEALLGRATAWMGRGVMQISAWSVRASMRWGARLGGGERG